jgi:hypothetical protein
VSDTEILIRIDSGEMKVSEVDAQEFAAIHEDYWQHAQSRRFVDSPAEPVADVYLRIERGNVAYTEYQPYFLLDEPIEVQTLHGEMRNEHAENS